MNSRELLAKPKMVVQAYESARAHYEKFNLQSPEYLRLAANDLCTCLNELLKERLFFKGLEVFEAEYEENRVSVSKAFEDLAKFLELEFEILRMYGIDENAAKTLIEDAACSIRLVKNHPELDSIENLRERISLCASEICKVSKSLLVNENEGSMRRKIFSALRPIGIGLRIVGGTTMIVVNAASAPVGPPFLLSVMAGLSSVGGGLASMR